MYTGKTKTTSLLDVFKSRYIYSECDNFGNLTDRITANDYDSAGYVSSVTSLVYSIIQMDQSEYKALYEGKHPSYHTVSLSLKRLFKRQEYKELFVSKNNFMLYGYQNCCYLWNKKGFEKHENEQPIYCDYLKSMTIGLPNYRFNPYIHIWVRALQTVYYQFMTIKRDAWKNYIDQLIKEYWDDDDFPYLSASIDLDIDLKRFNMAQAIFHYIRRDAEHSLVKNEIRNFKETPERNKKSAIKYINYLFTRHSKLLVLRIDLGYRRQAFEQINDAEAYAMIRRDIDRFFANMRHNTLFKHKVGHISKLEYGLDKGYHAHLILFFNGSKVQRDQYFSQEICKYWNTKITNGMGNAFNCHLNKYKYKGIGKISYTDETLRKNLIAHVVRYLVKPELFARVVVPGDSSGKHIFERGQIPPNRYPCGRRRKTVNGAKRCHKHA
jgi:hypothetical protein